MCVEQLISMYGIVSFRNQQDIGLVAEYTNKDLKHLHETSGETIPVYQEKLWYTTKIGIKWSIKSYTE